MMYAAVVGLLSLVSVSFATSNCNRGYEQYGKMCYKVSAPLYFATFQQAAWQCEIDGGDLASISNAFIDSFVMQLAEKTGAVDYWIGLKCPKGNLSECYWIDAATFNYNNFYFGYPSATYGETTAVSLQFLSRGHGKWYTSPSHMELRYVCEQRTRDNSTTTENVPTTTTLAPTTSTSTTKQTTTTLQPTSTAPKATPLTTQVPTSGSVATIGSLHPKNLRKHW